MAEEKKESIGKKISERVKYDLLKFVMLLSATFGINQKSGDAVAMNNDKPLLSGKDRTEQTINRDNEAAATECAAAENFFTDNSEKMPLVLHPKEYSRKLDEHYNQMLVANMIENQENILGNFDLSSRRWTREELKMIGSCSKNDAILKTAFKNVKKGKPQEGEQTYCLRAVKANLRANGITLDASSAAYHAIGALQKNDHFVELKGISYKDLTALPDGAIIVLGPGKDHPHGHIFTKGSQTWRGNTVYFDISDYRYYLSDSPRRGYGDMHVFVLKDMIVSKDLVQKMAEENIISNKYKAAFEINRARESYAAAQKAPYDVYNPATLYASAGQLGRQAAINDRYGRQLRQSAAAEAKKHPLRQEEQIMASNVRLSQQHINRIRGNSR